MCLQKGGKREESVQSGGEEEPEEDPHTPLPPPMEIIKDPNNPEVRRDGGREEWGKRSRK